PVVLLRVRSLVAVFAVSALFEPVSVQAGNKPIQITVVAGLVRDESPASVGNIGRRLCQVMKELTGLHAQASISGDALAIGRALDNKQCELALFQGFEFAWVQKRHPDLRPLLIAVNQHRYPRACLIVPKTGTAEGWADLKGKKLALPLGSKGHCLL